MARQPKATHIPAFAALLEDWGFEQRPRLKTHTDLATALGIPYNTVNNWFNGQKPRPNTLWQIARRTGIPIDELREAAGYLQEQLGDAPIDPWDMLYKAISGDTRIDEQIRAQTIETLQRIRDEQERLEMVRDLRGL